MDIVKAAAALAPSAKDGHVDAAAQLQSLMALTELPLLKSGSTLGDQVANILPVLLQASSGANADQSSQLGLLNFLMSVQKQNAIKTASGEKGDLMSLLLPALI
jgi:hypothetical protein